MKKFKISCIHSEFFVDIVVICNVFSGSDARLLWFELAVPKFWICIDKNVLFTANKKWRWDDDDN